MSIRQWIRCHIYKNHSWTCAMEQGIKATKQQQNSIEDFYDYAKMYCKHCGTVSKLSERR